MTTCEPIFKPRHKRKKTLRNKTPTVNDYCEVCGKPYSHQHEVFFGEKHRALSKKYSLTKRLCYEHHQGELGPHKNRQRDLELKKEYQQRFVDRYGYDKWMEIFQRDYSEM